MVFESKYVRSGVLFACFFALGLTITGIASPGWLILKRTITEEKASIFTGRIIDNGGLVGPNGPDDKPVMMERKRRETEEIEVVEEEVIEENDLVVDWFQKVIIEIEKQSYDVKLSYGLWYATLCIHERNEEGDDSSSSEEENHHKKGKKHHKKGHCHCKKISIKCALYNSQFFEDPIDYINPGPPSDRVLSAHNFGYASLVEQRIENCLSLVFLVIGVISAVGAARKLNGCRCAGYVCVFFMLLSALVSLIPVTRFGHYSVFKHKQPLPIHVGLPYSVLACGMSAFLCILITVMMCCGLARKSRTAENGGHWYKFNNELELPSEKDEKKPQLVFYTEPLPEKPDNMDI